MEEESEEGSVDDDNAGSCADEEEESEEGNDPEDLISLCSIMYFFWFGSWDIHVMCLLFLFIFML